jgi:hypothetical protein
LVCVWDLNMFHISASDKFLFSQSVYVLDVQACGAVRFALSIVVFDHLMACTILIELMTFYSLNLDLLHVKRIWAQWRVHCR